jgi:hypothetical protein
MSSTLAVSIGKGCQHYRLRLLLQLIHHRADQCLFVDHNHGLPEVGDLVGQRGDSVYDGRATNDPNKERGKGDYGGGPGAAASAAGQPEVATVNRSDLAPALGDDTLTTVLPEDRALQGCNPSAEEDSNTASPGGDDVARAGHPAGSIPMRRIPGGSGDSVHLDSPHSVSSTSNHCRVLSVTPFAFPAFHAEPKQK